MPIINKLLNDDKSGLIEENDDGNIEYKWKLDSKNPLTLKKLSSQLLWRLNEGKELCGIYEAHYVLGVFDNGNLGMLSLDELNKTIDIFKSVIDKVSVEITNSSIENINNSYIYCATIRHKPIDKKINEINIMFCGTEQVGKSSIISHICYSNKDNGNGAIRDYVMTHEHEKITGSTMCINKQIIGIKNNKLLNYNYSQNWEEIVKISDKIINIYDTPGNKKYLKTILKALRTYMIDVLFIVCNNNLDNLDNLDKYSKFLIKYASIFNIKYYLIKSKSDISYTYANNILNISTINPDLSDMDKMKEILINSEKNNTYKSFIPNTFRITSIYNIPDRNKIIAGIQTNGMLSYNSNNSNNYIVFPDLTYTKINIESIFKKNIDSMNIYEKETGSISYKITNETKDINRITKDINRITKDINTITKDCIITDEIGIEYIKNIDSQNLKLNILNIYDIQNDIQNDKYYLINCNISYIVNINIINNKCINIEFNNDFILQDNVCILIPFDFKDFNQIILCEIN
jgi:hypothetical protein